MASAVAAKLSLNHLFTQEAVVRDHASPGSDLDEEDRGLSTFTQSTPLHPLRVKPSGNALTANVSSASSMGTFATLPDSIILLLMENLDAECLVALGATCKGFFAFSTYDQLWRDLSLGDQKSSFQWKGSWRASRRRLRNSRLPEVDCSRVFADALYRPFQCSQLSLQPYVDHIPVANQIKRFSAMSAAEFSRYWSDTPFVLTDPVKSWKVFHEWDEPNLLNKYADTVFRAEAVDWPLRTYVEYMKSNDDESPLYLFDRNFAEKMCLSVGPDGDYQPPACFGEDLFMLLGDDRPDYRWLIVGPERSGSTFHKDPNATSAWNAVIRGSKYWILFPSSVLPPGVFMSSDQSEVTSPLSIAEWLLTFHQEARETAGCIEGICHAGEVLHVPSGWWHLVVNLEPATAITQNFVPQSHVRAAAHFLKTRPDQVSGFKNNTMDPYTLFMEKLRQNCPETYTEIHATLVRKRKWEEVVADKGSIDPGKQGFSFGFGDDFSDNES